MSTLVENLYKYSQDRAAMAAARSLKTQNPRGLQLVATLGGQLDKLEDIFIVQAFGHFPEKGTKDFPTAAASLNSNGALDTFFQKLINKTTKARACQLLLPLVLRLKSKNTAFDWSQLHRDLQNWESTNSPNTQYSWAQKFWKV